jgi:uncharacterized protein YkwD
LKFFHFFRAIATFWGLFCSLALLSGEAIAQQEGYAAFARKMLAVNSSTIRFRPDLEKHVFRLANAYRQQRRAHALSWNAKAQALARAHAMDMALNDFVGHTSSTGRNFSSRVAALDPDAAIYGTMAENAARVSSGEPVTSAKAGKLVTQWIKSGSHRKTLASRSYVSVATAVVQKGSKLYAVQVFFGPEVKTNMRRRPQGVTGVY